MIITDPNQLDLTGENSNYKRNLRRFKIFTANQLVELDDAAYLNTIKVYEVTGFDENNNPILKSLSSGNVAKTWSTDSTCEDVTAMAKAKQRYGYNPPEYLLTTDIYFQSGKVYYFKTEEDGVVSYSPYTSYDVGTQIEPNKYYEQNQETWNFVLVDKFYMNDSATDLLQSGEYEIAVEYNALEIECTAIKRDGLGPEYSPGLMRSVLDKIEELYYVRNPINTVSAITAADMYCLEEDLTGSNTKNYIEGEVHHVDVANNLFVIRPQNGSFYNTESLILSFQGYGPGSNTATISTTLVKDVDYVVTGINTEKTAISDPSCGVYEYIILKKSYTGKIMLSYQAFGGEVTRADINVLKELVQSVYQTVTSQDIVTVSNLSKTSVVRELIYRQQLLEHTVGHYQSQRFLYTASPVDKWVNVAFVDRNPWATGAPVPTSCIGEFRVKVPEMDFFMDIKVSYDTDATDGFNISVYHADIPTFENNSFEYFAKRLLPKFRLIWCKEGYTESQTTYPGTDRGIMLQMSMTCQTNKKFTVIVDDMTGAKSPWTLIDTLGMERPSTDIQSKDYYTNTAVKYGDENLFDWKAAIDHTSSVIPLYPNGYTVFVGSVPIDQIEEMSIEHSTPDTGTTPVEKEEGFYLPHTITGIDIRPNKVKAIEFKVYDRLTQKYLVGRSQEVITQNTSLSAEALYFMDDLCLVSCRLTFSGSNYTIHVKSKTGTNSLINKRFDLVQIDLIG